MNKVTGVTHIVLKKKAKRGRGRPALPKGKKREMLSIRLKPEIIEWLKNDGRSQSVLIETALRDKYKLDGKLKLK